MNARSNPFASRYMESLAYQCIDMPWENIMERLKSLHYRAAIIGSQGRGKTTLLEAIGERLQQDSFTTMYLRCNKENKTIKQAFIRSIPENLITSYAFLIDGAENISWLAWKQLCCYTRKAGALIITSTAKGRMPTLLCPTTNPDLLYCLVLQLIGDKKMIPRHEINHLFEFHQGNIRTALRELYDIWADRRYSKGAIKKS